MMFDSFALRIWKYPVDLGFLCVWLFSVDFMSVYMVMIYDKFLCFFVVFCLDIVAFSLYTDS